MSDALARAKNLYERSVFYGEAEALDAADRELDVLEAGVALARGRVVHARYLRERVEDPRERELFERAVAGFAELGDVRGEAESLFWLGTYHQVVHGDHDTAEPLLARARELAIQADDRLVLSYAVRHLGFVSMERGDRDSARALLEESVRLRREVGFQPGVAAGLLSLAHAAREDGDRDGGLALLDEAEQVANACSAKGIIGWIAQSRAEF
jgi:tetratricopeptide (TPR) repeat protein